MLMLDGVNQVEGEISWEEVGRWAGWVLVTGEEWQGFQSSCHEGLPWWTSD